MKKLFLICFAAAALLCGATEKSLSYTYSFTAPTLSGQARYADPGFRKLLSSGRKSPVIWRYRDNKRRPVILECHFMPGTGLSEVEIVYFRPHAVRKHTINYGIKNIKVIARTAGGKKVPIGGVVLNQPYAKPAGEPEKGQIRIPLEKIPLEAVEIHFTGNNGRLALCSLSFKGKAPAAGAAPKTVQKSSSVWQKEIDRAGKGLDVRHNGEYFILQNAKVIYAVSPEAGGTVVWAYDRVRKVNLIRQGSSGNDWGPFFQDRFYPGGTRARDAFRNSRFQAEKPERKDSGITLRLRGRGRTGHFTGVMIEKNFILEADTPVLKVEYAIHNMPENVVPLHNGFWCSGGVESDQGYNMIIPEKNKVTEIGFFPGYKEFPGISGNWCAVRTKQDNGIAFIMPGELLKSVCYWTSGIHRGTMECKFGIYDIKAGSALRFTAALVPFGGIGTPLHITESAAGSIKDGKVFIQFFRQGKYTLELFAGKIVKNRPQWEKVKTLTINSSAAPKAVSLPRLKCDGWTVLLKKQGKVLLRLEKAAAGKSFPLTPAAVKRRESRGSGRAGLDLNFNSTAVRGDFWNWAVPLAGKAPRVLGINYKAGGIRDMVELALRCGIKFDTHYISGRWTLTGNQDLTDARCVRELERKLKQNYDAVLISGDVWKKFTPAVKKIIMEKVRSGTGLVLVSPDGLPGELGSYCRKLPGRKNISRGAWRIAEKSSVVSGLPVEELPATGVVPYRISGIPLIKAAGVPLLSEFSFGKGKVFVFTYPAADSIAKSRRCSFFLPRMESVGTQVEWAYHEYQIALLARVVCQAARWKSCVRNGQIRITAPGTAELVLESQLSCKVKLQYSVRDRFSALKKSYVKELSLKKGINKFQLLFEVPHLRGKYFVNAKVDSGKGILWWGAAAGENKKLPEILSLNFPEKVYKRSENLSGTVRVKGKGSLRVTLWDSRGNCLGISKTSAFAFPLKYCATPSGKLRVELLSGNKVVDRKEKRFVLYFTPDPLDFNIAFGWPSLSVRAHIFNYDLFLKQMGRFGITCLNGDRYSLDVPAAEAALRDWGWPQFSTQTHGFLGTKKPYNRHLVPKHKFELVRTPCLSKAEFRKKLAADSARLYPNFKLGALMVAGPDESNMFAQWDGCFTPECRKKFRQWLKKEYGSLTALNNSWQTKFQKWDDVTAMTLAEVRGRRSFAPWLDHRSFNDWNRADALKELAEGIRKTAPLGYSFSGTQETNPFNAWDWYQMMPYLGGVSSYYGEQTIQQRSFARGKFFQMPWIGYDSPFKRMDRQLWIGLMNGATGVNLYGASFYIQSDFTLSPTANDLIRVLDRYRKGAAQTLQSAELPGSEIAIHYTPASLKVNEVLELTAVRSSAVTGIRTLLNEKNLSFRYLAYGEIEKADFKGVKVLFLPLSTALSVSEVKALDRFAEQGGVIIADMLTGHYDQHGAPAQGKEFKKLFGIRKRGILRKASGRSTLNGAQIRVLCFESGLVPAPGVRVSGKNPDGTPAVLINRKGKGMTIYMGASLLSACGDLQEIRYSKANAPVMKEMLALISKALDHTGVRASFRIPGLQSTEVLIRHLGKLRFAGVGRNFEETVNAGLQKEKKKVFLDREYYIYDLFKRQYLGNGRSFDFVFAPDAHEIFALLPYKVTGIRLNVKTPAKNLFQVAGGVLVSKGKADVHTLRFELSDPAGKKYPEYSSWQRTAGGSVVWEWQAPCNALPGKWDLTVTDTISGCRKGVKLNVSN